jgi:hypothetical protein
MNCLKKPFMAKKDISGHFLKKNHFKFGKSIFVRKAISGRKASIWPKIFYTRSFELCFLEIIY